MQDSCLGGVTWAALHIFFPLKIYLKNTSEVISSSVQNDKKLKENISSEKKGKESAHQKVFQFRVSLIFSATFFPCPQNYVAEFMLCSSGSFSHFQGFSLEVFPLSATRLGVLQYS